MNKSLVLLILLMFTVNNYQIIKVSLVNFIPSGELQNISFKRFISYFICTLWLRFLSVLSDLTKSGQYNL